MSFRVILAVFTCRKILTKSGMRTYNAASFP
jgi:hypothetical protein